jgi:hypothetical protein
LVTGYNAPKSYKGYRLKWADEFNGTALNLKLEFERNGDGHVCEVGATTDGILQTGKYQFKNGKMIIEAKKSIQ